MRRRSGHSAPLPEIRLLLVGVLIATVLGSFTLPGHASCAAPVVTAPRRASAGATIYLEGEYWSAECNDTQACSVGCLGESCEGGGPNAPARNIRVVLVSDSAQDDFQAELAGGITADEDLRFEVDVALPWDLAPGRYRLLVGNDRTGMYPSGLLRVE